MDSKHTSEFVQVLHEALPYIQKFQNQTIVVKYGGNAMVDPKLKDSFAKDIILMKLTGINPVIVHGGGPQISKQLEQLGIEASFINGLRVTSKETMEVVEMVLGGQVNREIVNFLNLNGGRAIGLTGKDDHFLMAEKLEPKSYTDQDNQKLTADLGQVGAIKQVKVEYLKQISQAGFIPVIAPIGVDSLGNALNINADFVASAVAEALSAERLILLTNTPGVLDKHKQLISVLEADQISDLIEDGTITAGMIPKTECIQAALNSGVKSAHILDGRVPNCLLLELFSDSGIGTLIKGKSHHLS